MCVECVCYGVLSLCLGFVSVWVVLVFQRGLCGCLGVSCGSIEDGWCVMDPLDYILSDIESALEYVRGLGCIPDDDRFEVLKGRWMDGESVIAGSAKISYLYALNVVKGRFELGEGVMAGDPSYAGYYAKDVLKRRWPEGEETILSRGLSAACWYARDVIKGRWPEAEWYLLLSPKLACWYARDVVNGRWPEAEGIIGTDPVAAYLYARYVVNGRWPGGEMVIAGSKEYSRTYVFEVLYKWLEDHPWEVEELRGIFVGFW